MGGGLIDPGDESFGTLHVGAVRFAEGLQQGGFLHVDAPQDHAGAGYEDGEQRSQVANADAVAEQHHQPAGVTGMPHMAVGAGLDQLVVGGNGDVDGEKAAEIQDATPTKAQARNEQAEPDRIQPPQPRRRPVLPMKGQVNAEPDAGQIHRPDHEQRSAVFGDGIALGALEQAQAEFREAPEGTQNIWRWQGHGGWAGSVQGSEIIFNRDFRETHEN